MTSDEIAQRIEQIDQRCIQLSGDSRIYNVTMCCFGIGHWHISSSLPKLSASGKSAKEAFSNMETELSKIEMRQNSMAKEFGMEYAV